MNPTGLVAGWQGFFSAVAGAGATLCGLVFVALALNLEAIRRSPALVGRAGEAVWMLLATLLLSLLGLIPRVTPRTTGELLLGVGLLVWGAVVRVQIAAFAEQRHRFLGYYVLRVCMGQVALLPILVGAAGLCSGWEGGMGWVASGLVLMIVVGVFDAWVLAVEIVR